MGEYMNDTATEVTATTAAPEMPTRPFPGIIASFVWIIVFFILQVIGIISVAIFATISAMKRGVDPAKMSQQDAMQMIGGLPLIWSLVATSALTLFLLWLYLHRKGRIAAIGLDRWSQLDLKTTMFLAVLWCGAAMIFNFLYETYVIPGVKMQGDLRMLFESIPETFANRAVLFATIAVLAPALEELLFRGLLQKSLSHRMPIAAAIGISSAIFAAMHLDYYAFPALFAMGAVFGYLYYRTGSLRVNILLHMINNGAALVLSWVMPG
jgi:uncharacterized protein